MEQKQFTSDMLNNCFFVDKINQHGMCAVPLKSVFDEIIKRATESGLVMEITENKVTFLPFK